jgi:SAM-dependent methyltransferase
MNKDFDWLHATFPKQRTVLPAAYQALYEEEYKRNRGCHNSSPDFKQKLEHWMHRQVANTAAPDGAVLEIGAGTLNHVCWEEALRPYDIVEPFTALYEGQSARTRLRNIFQDIGDVPVGMEYSKILSVAVLEHVENLPQLVARTALLLRDDGVMVHGVPSEGGILWYLAWRFGTGLSFSLRTGLSYATLMRHEHVNNVAEIVRVLRIFFADVSCSHFPLPLLHGSFYTCVRMLTPDKERAAAYLEVDA